MFEDRLALMEKEFNKQKDVCVELYKKVAIYGNLELKPQYDKEKDKLIDMEMEINLLKEIIKKQNNS